MSCDICCVVVWELYTDLSGVIVYDCSYKWKTSQYCVFGELMDIQIWWLWAEYCVILLLFYDRIWNNNCIYSHCDFSRRLKYTCSCGIGTHFCKVPLPLVKMLNFESNSCQSIQYFLPHSMDKGSMYAGSFTSPAVGIKLKTFWSSPMHWLHGPINR